MSTRKPKPTPGEAYIIQWTDANWNEEQGAGDEEEIGTQCESIGFVVKVTNKGIRMAMERDVEPEDREYRYFIDIPNGMITKITKMTNLISGS